MTSRVYEPRRRDVVAAPGEVHAMADHYLGPAADCPPPYRTRRGRHVRDHDDVDTQPTPAVAA